MSLVFKDVDKTDASKIRVDVYDDVIGVNRVHYVIIEASDMDGTVIVDLDIDTAIQLRKELQRQIMKAKALEKEGRNG